MQPLTFVTAIAATFVTGVLLSFIYQVLGWSGVQSALLVGAVLAGVTAVALLLGALLADRRRWPQAETERRRELLRRNADADAVTRAKLPRAHGRH